MAYIQLERTNDAVERAWLPYGHWCTNNKDIVGGVVDKSVVFKWDDFKHNLFVSLIVNPYVALLMIKSGGTPVVCREVRRNKSMVRAFSTFAQDLSHVHSFSMLSMIVLAQLPVSR
jgi:hypothetical protein